MSARCCAMRRGGKVRSRMQRAIPEPICRIQLCQSNTHNDSPCLRDEKRWESAMERSTACAVVPDPCRSQRAPCTLADPQSPAVDIFALADPVRRLTARNIQKIARTRPQADSPATLQMIVPYDSRNLTLTNEVSQTPRDCHSQTPMPRHSRRRPRVRAASPSLDSIANGGLLSSACVGSLRRRWTEEVESHLPPGGSRRSLLPWDPSPCRRPPPPTPPPPPLASPPCHWACGEL